MDNKACTTAKDWNDFVIWHMDRIFRQCTSLGLPMKDYIEFPIEWDRQRPLIEFLFYLYKQYLKDLEEFFCYEPCTENRSDYKNTGERYKNCEKCKITNIKSICNSILDAYYQTLQWNTEHVIELLNRSPIKDILKNTIATVEANTNLYRLRSDDNLVGKNDFMHTPFDQIYNCNSMRFSMAGTPCLYLGYSKVVCRKELGIKEGGSIGHFRSNSEFRVVDLTLEAQQKGTDIDMFELWPILAACYTVAPDRESNFKEEYVFPQILMHYIRKNYNVDGLRYYSCRNKRLNPFSTEYMNVAFFAKINRASTDNDAAHQNTTAEVEPTFDIDKCYPIKYEIPYDKDLCEKLDFIQ